MCLRVVHLKDEREMILSISFCSPTIKCDLVDISFPTCGAVPVTGTGEQPCCTAREVSWGLNKTLSGSPVSLVRAYAPLDDAAKTGGGDDA